MIDEDAQTLKHVKVVFKADNKRKTPRAAGKKGITEAKKMVKQELTDYKIEESCGKIDLIRTSGTCLINLHKFVRLFDH